MSQKPLNCRYRNLDGKPSENDNRKEVFVMSKIMRSLVCLVMCLVLVLSMNVWSSVSAEETAIQPRLSYTNYTFTGLDITTKGVAYCTADAEGYEIGRAHV